MTPGEAIDNRLSEIRAALEACAAEGFDPAGIYMSSAGSGQVWVHPRKDGRKATEGEARAILARLTGGEPERSDNPDTSSSSYEAGGFVVFAEMHPDASAEQSEGAPGGE